MEIHFPDVAGSDCKAGTKAVTKRMLKLSFVCFFVCVTCSICESQTIHNLIQTAPLVKTWSLHALKL